MDWAPLLLIWLVVWLGFGAGTAAVAHSRGRSAVGWFFVGFFLGVIGLIIALAVPRTPRNEMARAARLGLIAPGAYHPHPYAAAARCPFCAETIQPQATVCRWCGSNLPQGPVITAPPAAPGTYPYPGPVPPPVTAPVARTVADPGATLRDTPAGSVEGQVAPGTFVIALEQSGAWIRVEAPDGMAGWVRESDLVELPRR